MQLFLVCHGLAQFEAVRESIFWKLLREPYWCALLVFSLNTAAYSARIFYGAMCETDRGEWEAALAFGLAAAQTIDADSHNRTHGGALCRHLAMR